MYFSSSAALANLIYKNKNSKREGVIVDKYKGSCISNALGIFFLLLLKLK